MRVVGYVRVSTDEQASAGVSLEAQEAKLRAYCAAHGHELVKVVSDPGKSAGSLDREGVSQCLYWLDVGWAEGLLVAKLDRLTRNVADFAYLLESYFSKRMGRWLLSASEHVDTRTASGRLVLFIQVAVSQWELEANHERTEDALGHKQSRGERTGSVPFGFDLDEQGPRNRNGKPVRLVPNPHEQGTIALIRSLNGKGLSDRKIAAELNGLRIATKTGVGSWRHSTVAKILDRKPTPETTDAPEALDPA